MQVKCYLAEGPEADLSMMELLSLARGVRGQTSLEALTNDRAGISLSKNRAALVLVGGRDSIHDFLLWRGNTTLIIGARPFLVTFARKHRVFGKNETCLKLVSGPGHRQPEDGSEFIPLGAKGTNPQLTVSAPELAHCLHIIYNWG